MRLIALFYLLMHVSSFRKRGSQLKELYYLLAVVMADFIVWANPEVVLTILSREGSVFLLVLILLLEFLLFCRCYLLSKPLLFINHYVFLGFVFMVVAGSILSSFMSGLVSQLLLIIGAAGVLLYGSLNHLYLKGGDRR